jgi:uncharacterized protein involved in exopolysaccharide biosynthesis
VLLGAALIAGLVVGVRTMMQPRTYTSVGTFVLQGGRSGANVAAGIASQFGFSLPTTDAAQSPALYVDVLRSRTVLSEVAHALYCDPCNRVGPTTPLARLLGIAGPDTGLVSDKAIERLRQMVSGDANQRTGIVMFSATATSPVLAQQIAQNALDAVTRFNLRTRQSQAGAERRFTEARLQDVAGELQAAEQRLKYFRETNRIAISPELQLRENQLDREVRRYEDVYSALARSLEQSKIDELRDTPTVVVIDPPALPYTPNPRGTVFRALFAAIFGAALAAAVIVVMALRGRSR